MSFIVKETFFGSCTKVDYKITKWKSSDSDGRVQPSHSYTAMKALHQRYTLCASSAILICALLMSPYADSPITATRTSSSLKEMPSL